MFNNISWASYVYAITIILVIYYAIVLILYYRNDLQYYLQNLNTGFNQQPGKIFSPEPNIIEFVKRLKLEDDAASSVKELLLSVQALINNATLENLSKEELQYSLQIRLKDVPTSKSSFLKDNINQFIIAACQNHSSIHLNVDEVSALWIE